MTIKNHNRDLFLDFLKGLAIIFVIFEHSFNLEIMVSIHRYLPIQSVPIFMLITLYLSFDKLSGIRESEIFKEWFLKNRIKLICKKLLQPYIIVALIAITIIMSIKQDPSIFIEIIKQGGVGPGSYYIWVYLQIWFLIPVIYKLLKEKGNNAIIMLLGICICVNILFSYYEIPDWLYRLLCVRYIFLTAVAYIWLNLSLYSKKMVGTLIVISTLYLLFFRFADLAPLVYNRGMGYS